MGILTDFFVANDDELAATFSGWLRVADTPIERDVKNPFTGEIQRIKEWPPGNPIGDGRLAETPDIRRLPHAEWKWIGSVELARLNEILNGKPLSETLDAVRKPALVHPTSDETGLDVVPGDLITAIGKVSEQAIENIAAKWQQTSEMQAHHFSVEVCEEILHSLRSLTMARGPDQKTYVLWSL